MTELIPTKATFAPGEPIEVEVRGDAATVSLWRLERKVAEVEPVDGIARFAVAARRRLRRRGWRRDAPRSTCSPIRSRVPALRIRRALRRGARDAKA